MAEEDFRQGPHLSLGCDPRELVATLSHAELNLLSSWLARCSSAVEAEFRVRAKKNKGCQECSVALTNGFSEIAKHVLKFGDAGMLSRCRVGNYQWHDMASADDLWYPLSQSRWLGTVALHGGGFITSGFQSMYSRRSRLERMEREFSEVVEWTPPEVVVSDFSVLVELVSDGAPILNQLFDISTVSAKSVDVVIPDDTRLQLQPQHTTLDVTVVRRRDGMYKRLFRQPAISNADPEELQFEVEVVQIVPESMWVKVQHLEDYDGGFISQLPDVGPPNFHYNCDLFESRRDGMMTKRLHIQLWSSLESDLVPGTHVLRSFDILGEWV